jgi:tape measure domain-containing protein
MATEKVAYELSLRDLMTKGLNDINTKLGSMEKKLTDTERAAKQTSASMSQAFAKTQNSAGSLQRSFASLKTGVVALLGTGIIALGAETITAAAKMESMNNAIVFASGSAQEGAKNLAFLKGVTQKMPIDLDAAQQGFKTFSGAVMGSSLQGDKARHIFTSVSKAASVMGLSADETKGIFLALGQMVSKGTVQAEELKGQLGERLPGAFQLAAKSMGITTAALGDYMKAGMITAEDLLPRLANELDKTYSKGMGDANNSINAQIVRLGNLKHEMVEGSIPAVKGLTKAFTDSVFLIKANWEPMGDYFGGIFNQYKDLGSSLGQAFGWTSDKGDGILFFFKSLATVISTTTVPMQLIVAALLTSVDAITSLSNLNFDGFKERFNKRITNPFKTIDNIWSDDTQGETNKSGTTTGDSFASGLGIAKKPEYHQFGTNFMDTWNPEFALKKKKGLKDASESVSGGVPKVVNINIEALNKDVKITVGSGSSFQKDMASFMEDLEKALLTVVNDVNIVSDAR